MEGTSVADRVHEQLGLFFRWYAGRDDDFTSPLVRTIKRHRKGTGARPMTDDELRLFWSSCDKAGLAGAAARLCLLTATRRNETTHARWAEVSNDGIWTIPSDRYKTKLEHMIPLSGAARQVLSNLPHLSLYIFSATRCPPDTWTLWTAVARAGGPIGEGLSWHSLRKTARTLMSRAGVRSDHAERALGHVQAAIQRAYDKHSYLAEKRAAFEALAVEITRVAEGQPTDTVITMPKAAFALNAEVAAPT
jgi:integrase